MADLDRENLYVMQIIKPILSGSALRAKRNGKTGIYDLTSWEYEENPYTFPMPSIDGFTGSYVTNVDGGNNANGDYEGVVISSKVNISGFEWTGLDKSTGRALLKIFTGGDNLTFFARYYDVIEDKFIIRQFRRGDIEYSINNVMGTQVGNQRIIDVDFWQSIKIPVNEV